jgi:hypothetical protein
LHDSVDWLLPGDSDGLDAAAAEIPQTLGDIINDALEPILRAAIAERRMTVVQRLIREMGRK